MFSFRASVINFTATVHRKCYERYRTSVVNMFRDSYQRQSKVYDPQEIPRRDLVPRWEVPDKVFQPFRLGTLSIPAGTQILEPKLQTTSKSNRRATTSPGTNWGSRARI
jgi:hypothetical protein